MQTCSGNKADLNRFQRKIKTEGIHKSRVPFDRIPNLSRLQKLKLNSKEPFEEAPIRGNYICVSSSSNDTMFHPITRQLIRKKYYPKKCKNIFIAYSP